VSTVVEPPVAAAVSPEPPRKRRWLRWMLGAVCVVIAGMWAYVFLFRPTTAYDDVYLMTTPGWSDQAKAICDDANARRVALRDMGDGMITDPTPAQMVERADLVDRATDIVEKMVDDVVAIPVTSPEDTGRIQTFQKFYDVVIGDRRTYAASLRSLELVPYRESEAAGGPVSNVVTDFTSANGIPRCAPPGELGNG
jgi:hypothetical protein